MGQDSPPSVEKALHEKKGAGTADPSALADESTGQSSAYLVTFQPPLSLSGLAPLSREAMEADFAKRTLRWQKRRRARHWTIFLGGLALVSIVLAVGPGLYHHYKGWRAATLALKAESLVRENKIEQALPAIRSAFQTSPNNPEVLRAVAQILTAFNAPDAMTYWNWILQGGDATDDDRRAAADCAMHYGLYNEASVIINDLLARHGGDARNELLAARWSAGRGTSTETMRLATRAVNLDPGYKPAVLYLAALEINNTYLHQEGVNSLFKLAASNDDFGLRALQYLAVDPNLKPGEIERLITRLHAHPLAGELERIAALNLEINLHPDRREALLDQAMAEHHKSTPADLATFAEWLNNHQQADRVLQFIPRERALSNKALFAAYIEALDTLHRWAELKTALTGTSVPMEIPFVELYLSRCASKTGDDQSSDLHWQNAVAAAAYNPAESFRLALYAEKIGQNERAAGVYRALTQDPIAARAAYEGLLRVSGDEDTRALRDLLDEIVSRWPNDIEMQSEDIYLNLLLNEHVPEMRQRATAILAEDSNNISHRTNVALACLRLNDPAGARQAYSHVSIDWNTAPVPDLIVYAATLDASGHTRSAHRLLLSVNRHELRPESRDLIKSIP